MKLLKKYKAFTYACASYHSGWSGLILSKKYQAFVPSNQNLSLTEEAYSHGGLQTRELGQNVIKVIEKSLGGRFFWNRNWDLGWIWAGWHYWKKTLADYEQLLRPVFFIFSWTKKNQKHCGVPTKNMHKMKLKKHFFS